MQQIYKNLCIRCGKERTVVRKWTEKFEYGNVTTTQTTCPDPECQKIVSKEIKDQKEKKELMARIKEKRIRDKKAEKKNKKSSYTTSSRSQLR